MRSLPLSASRRPSSAPGLGRAGRGDLGGSGWGLGGGARRGGLSGSPGQGLQSRLFISTQMENFPRLLGALGKEVMFCCSAGIWAAPRFPGALFCGHRYSFVYARENCMVGERVYGLTDPGLESSSAPGCEFRSVIAPLCTLIPSPVTSWCQRPLHFEKLLRGVWFCLCSYSESTKIKPCRALNGTGSPDFLVYRAPSIR